MMTPPFSLPKKSRRKEEKKKTKRKTGDIRKMTTPVAKGLIISISALVAASIAVYESPQCRRWVEHSRRKLAQALHNLGDEIQPREFTSPFGEDISMTEETGEAAEERRRMVREELERRSAQLAARKKKTDSTSPPSSFDSLVDREGHLLDLDDDMANSTAVDPGTSRMVQRGKIGNGLHIDMPAFEPQPGPPSQFTPTSEAPGTGASRPESQLSSHTEGSYIHHRASPEPSNETHQSPFPDLSDMGSADHAHPEHPSTPSTSSSFSHIYESAADASSDGTLSDLGRSVGGVATPASWSEVGSVVSNEDANYQHF